MAWRKSKFLEVAPVTLPDPFYADVLAVAQAESRTINGVMVEALRRYIDAFRKRHPNQVAWLQKMEQEKIEKQAN